MFVGPFLKIKHVCSTRCGYEFCYTCGAEWKNKKATCSCPLWNERNILFEDSDYDNEVDDDDYNSDSNSD